MRSDPRRQHINRDEGDKRDGKTRIFSVIPGNDPESSYVCRGVVRRTKTGRLLNKNKNRVKGGLVPPKLVVRR